MLNVEIFFKFFYFFSFFYLLTFFLLFPASFPFVQVFATGPFDSIGSGAVIVWRRLFGLLLQQVGEDAARGHQIFGVKPPKFDDPPIVGEDGVVKKSLGLHKGVDAQDGVLRFLGGGGSPLPSNSPMIPIFNR